MEGPGLEEKFLRQWAIAEVMRGLRRRGVARELALILARAEGELRAAGHNVRIDRVVFSAERMGPDVEMGVDVG